MPDPSPPPGAAAPLTYADLPWPVRPEVTAAQQRCWARLARPGTWFTGAGRVAIAAEVRAAPHCALCRERRSALSPHAVDGAHTAVTDLPADVVEVVHRVTTDPGRLTRPWYDGLLAGGLTAGEYVEAVGTVAAVVSIDSFCRGVGAPLHPLPRPEPGAPSRYTPASAGPDDAWVPMVPADNSGTPEADLWPAGQTGNVIRALSLVPDEVRTLLDLSDSHYVPIAAVIGDLSVGLPGLDRQQVELLAARVSALNQCFY